MSHDRRSVVQAPQRDLALQPSFSVSSPTFLFLSDDGDFGSKPGDGRECWSQDAHASRDQELHLSAQAKYVAAG